MVRGKAFSVLRTQDNCVGKAPTGPL